MENCYWLLENGYWLLEIGYWEFVIGGLVIGKWYLVKKNYLA
jgi:hypothetical protein